ncbi:MAG: gamma-glutamyltransferase [Gammaproteobacteria bacterium]|nr:MAG: gamma-glutamyltransferase [Gammaproteobacteria bacterium]
MADKPVTTGVIAAGHEVTAGAAESILREGGNAYDAVFAAAAAACVCEPVLCSLGGGGFLMAHPAGGQPRLYDFFVQTPSLRRPADELEFGPIVADFGTAQQEFHIGRGAIAVPGMVRGVFDVHRELGSMPLSEVFVPAIEAARGGVVINALHAYIFSVVEAIYMAGAKTRTLYGSSREAGRLVGEGETLRQPEFADTLETLALEGADLFYRGEIAQSIVGDLRDGGQLTAQDLENYRLEIRRPLEIGYRDRRLLTNPPPSTGGLLIGFALRLLEPLELNNVAFGSADHLRTLAEAMRLTNEARIDAHVDDKPLDPNDVQLLDPKLIEKYRQIIAGRAASRRGTTHISVIDGNGNIAALSLSNGEGSGYVAPGTGIVLNNMLGEEDLNPGGFHRWPLSHRMTSMMAPSILESADGTAVAIGSGGSNRIRTAILQVLLNLIDFDMDIEAAVDAPRIHYENGLLSMEDGIDLERAGSVLKQFPQHQVWEGCNLFFGGTHAAVSARGDFHGAGDPRRGGVCIKVGA